MILLAGFYEDSVRSRMEEYIECLRRNSANPLIAGIRLFLEDPICCADAISKYSELRHRKIELIEHGQRLTFSQLFSYANCHLSGSRVALANADIFFDDSLALLEGRSLTGKVLCLSRWDENPDGTYSHFDREDSQDAWVFEPPLPHIDADFFLGTPGCENRLAFEADRAGLSLSNPSQSLRARHLHRSQIRHYTERQRVTGPVRKVPTSSIGGPENVPNSDLRASNCRSRPAEQCFAITSLSRALEKTSIQRACIESWQAAGLAVRSFNHPSEIPELRERYSIEFVPVTDTSEPVFGRHYVPISAMLNWAGEHQSAVLLINSDIQLELLPWEMKRLQYLADGGLCYFVRHNYNGNLDRAVPEACGIDAMLMHGRNTGIIPPSFLSMGQPWWDYWIPHTFVSHGHAIFSVEFPAAFHRNHPLQWSWENWHECALEFDRMALQLDADRSFNSCIAMSLRVRESFDRQKTPLCQQPGDIRGWVERTFAKHGEKTFLELGSHQGTDTEWLAEIPDVTVHAFEPDPRNQQPPRQNVILNQAAIADRDGHAPFILSKAGWGQEWTYSSSIKIPKNHLQRYPVTFGETIQVDIVTLDTIRRERNLDIVDFIWADIQGAEEEMILGGRETLTRTRYLYTEYSDEELYEAQITLDQILAMLPRFRVVELWSDNVLLENRDFHPR